MSRSSLENGEPGNGAAPTGATPVRSVQELDHRRRGLFTKAPHELPPSSPRTDHHHHRRGPLLVKLAAFVAVTALAVLLVRGFVVQPFAQAGNAMAPTLQAGDRMLVLKLGTSIDSGDVVVVHPPRSLPCTGDQAGDLALRVVAVPGEAISSSGDKVYVDGRPGFGRVGSTPIRSTTLAPGRYFVMTDKRSQACDSRTFGPISKSAIRGKGIAVVGRHGHLVLKTF